MGRFVTATHSQTTPGPSSGSRSRPAFTSCHSESVLLGDDVRCDACLIWCPSHCSSRKLGAGARAARGFPHRVCPAAALGSVGGGGRPGGALRQVRQDPPRALRQTGARGDDPADLSRRFATWKVKVGILTGERQDESEMFFQSRPPRPHGHKGDGVFETRETSKLVKFNL